MDWMLPPAPVIYQRPLFHAILLHGEAALVTVEELAVDLPAAAAVLELERSFDPGRSGRAWQIIELGDRGRVLTIVGHLRTVHDDLEDPVALTRRDDCVVCGSPSVSLLQSVLDVDRLASERGEVDNYVCAFGHAEPDALDLERFR